MIGYACLMLAGGMNSLIIPIRGGSEGFSSLALGLLGTSWAFGFIIGAFYVPSMVLRVGHVRVFSVMASIATLAVIISLIVIDPIVWIPMRAAAGFCFAGSAMIVESWVNERTNSQTRGKVFGVYTMVNLTATTAGQMLLVTGDTSGPIFFLIAAVSTQSRSSRPPYQDARNRNPCKKHLLMCPLCGRTLPLLWLRSL